VKQRTSNYGLWLDMLLDKNKQNELNYPANKGIRSSGMLFTTLQLRAPHPRVHGSFFQAFA